MMPAAPRTLKNSSIKWYAMTRSDWTNEVEGSSRAAPISYARISGNRKIKLCKGRRASSMYENRSRNRTDLPMAFDIVLSVI